VKGAETGDVACDTYHRYKKDVTIARKLNLKSDRFSISWPRIQADGTGKPNPKGIALLQAHDGRIERGEDPAAGDAV
jgi:beta-glucosidase